MRATFVIVCETLETRESSSRRRSRRHVAACYLHLYADLTLSCDSDEYEDTKVTAFSMLAVWPVGGSPCFTLTSVLLCGGSRKAI
eukprot:2524677-Prymnesium_polylepis.1